jgi:hypothetical protein
LRAERSDSGRTLSVVVVALVTLVSLIGGGLLLLRERGGDVSTEPARQPVTREARIRAALFAEVQPVALANCELERFGEERDGGYLMCGNLLDEVEAGYSYGISGYDGWGCEISERLKVRVHQYDCFDTRTTSCPAGDVAFHAECVAGTTYVDDENRRFDTPTLQFARNGDAIRRLVVKMDVEGAEWDALAELSGEALARIDQLTVEFHQVDDERFIGVMRHLKEHFHVANLHFNNYSCDDRLTPFPAWAYEVLLVNKRIARLSPDGARPAGSPLDTANTLIVPDCQAVTGRPTP